MALFPGSSVGTSFSRKALIFAAALVTIILLLRQSGPALIPATPWNPHDSLPSSQRVAHDAAAAPGASDPLPLPEAYNAPPPSPEDWCERAYGLSYLREYRDNRRSQCQPRNSASAVECFNIGIGARGSESFCVANNVLLRPRSEAKPFAIDCEVHSVDSERSQGGVDMPGLWDMREHMGETGVAILLGKFFDIANTTMPLERRDRTAMSACARRKKSSDYTILIKRDHGRGTHPWHGIMELYSYFLTMDILQMAPREQSKRPFFSPDDIANAQVVILDDGKDGPFFDLWSVMARKPVIRLADLRDSSETLCLDNVVLPLPGAANPMWLGDWTQRNCTNAPLLDVFSRRIQSTYGVVPVSRATDTPLVLTYVVRHTHRRLHDAEAYLTHLRAKFPAVKIQGVDFAQYSLREQIEIVSGSDILVGVHGAALTWQMLMPRGSSLVELMPYDFHHRGFRNMAKLLGHRYFSIHGSEGSIDEKGWQHTEEIVFEESRFVGVVEAAIYSMYHRGLRIDDVN